MKKGAILMKKVMAAMLIPALILILLAGCGEKTPDPAGTTPQLGGDDAAFGESLEALDAYAGYFEEDVQDVTVTCVSGTPGCYTLEGGTLTFTQVSQDSVYAVSGKLKGNIVIDAGEGHKFDLELQGLCLVSDSACPIVVRSGDEVSLTAKKDYQNYIYDTRPAVDSEDISAFSGAIYSAVDLEVCGKGSLKLVSEYNNGIHGKDDLQVKNLSLLVACVDNALKGNDSVQITGGELILISSSGDGIKTANSDISKKGNQRGTISISGANVTVYAACDGLDAAYDVVIQEDTTVLNVFTDKYSNYSSTVTAVDSDSCYIRFSSQEFNYAVKHLNSEDDFVWAVAEYHSTVSGGRSSYYYYAFDRLEGYDKVQYYIYSSDQTPGQDQEYLACTEAMTVNTDHDTFALSVWGDSLSYSFTNYSTTVVEDHFGPGGHGRPGGMGGMGGMNEGNPDKGDYSTKGIKAANAVRITGGTVTVKAYDDAIHANAETALENGQSPTGDVIISGGTLRLYSNDDGIHADGKLTVSGADVDIESSFEGLEGTTVEITGGAVAVTASDDGINSTATSGTGVTVSGGKVYVCCSGDGIDTNSRTADVGIVFAGGDTVVITDSGMNSAIDTEQGYTYTAGRVVAVMPSGGMTGEATHCDNFDAVATSGKLSLINGNYLTVSAGGATVVTVQLPTGINGRVIYLGSNGADMACESTTAAQLDANGVAWN